MPLANPRMIYKVILAGDGGTGKSTFLRTKLTGRFTPAQRITIGIDFDCYVVDQIAEPLSLLIFDLGGQKHFQFIHKAFILGGKAGIIFYDLTRPDTLQTLPHWVNLLQTEYPSIPILVCGTKRDLVESSVTRSLARQYNEIRKKLPPTANIIDHYQISCTIPDQCEEVFDQIQILAQKWRTTLDERTESGVPAER